MQKTNFAIRIIIGDDGSTDKSKSIIREYSERFPDIIFPFFHDTNLGAQKNSAFLFSKCHSKYIALCDGDDYWTDPLKLQKQVDFLESNPEYSMSFHNAKIINDANEIISNSYLGNDEKKDMSADDLLFNKRYAPTLTLCFRNISQSIPPEMIKAKLGDMFLLSLLGNLGKGKFQEDIRPSAYRYHTSGIWSMTSDLKKKLMARSFYKQIGLYYKRVKQTKESDYYIHKQKEINPKILHDSIQAKQTKTVLRAAFWCLGENKVIFHPKKSILLFKTLVKYFLSFKFKSLA